MNDINNSKNMISTRIRFSSRIEGILSLEKSGNLDLSYNRELALGDAAGADKTRPAAMVFIDAENRLFTLDIAEDGLLVLNRYEPFGAIISSSKSPVYIPCDINDQPIRPFHTGRCCEVRSFKLLQDCQFNVGEQATRDLLRGAGLVVGNVQ